MDNFSHTVAGLAVGEFIHRRLPQESDDTQQKTRRRLLLLVAALASNFPDLDLVLTPLLPAPLGYLLHHRGHTHTLLYAIPQALLLAGLVWLLWPAARRLLRASSGARRGFGWALAAGLALHILMDGLNSYGIHPFHPFDSRWIYGDMVFILEPVFWIAFGVPVVLTAGSPPLRIILLALLLGIPLYFTTKGYLAWPSFGMLVLIAAVLALLQWRAGSRGVQALVAAAAVSVAFVGMQAIASAQAARTVGAALLDSDPESKILDVALTPFPTHPLCWIFVSVSHNEALGQYGLRRGVLSLAPGITPVAECPPGLASIDVPPDASPAIAFMLDVYGDVHALRELAATNCHFAAWMRFARAPLVGPEDAIDIRYPLSAADNFTRLRFADFIRKECPSAVPQWGFPRLDLLQPATGTGARD
jgi:inner membrane protein